MSGESYTRWHNQPSDDDEDEAGEGGGGRGGGGRGGGGGGVRLSGGGVTIVTSPSHHHHHRHLQHHQDLTSGARARLLCIMVLVCLTCLTMGVLLGYYAGSAEGRGREFLLEEAAKVEQEAPPLGVLPSGDAGGEIEDEEKEEDMLASALLKELKPGMIKGYMRQLQQTPKTLLADYLESAWKAQGLQTSTTSFTVNLSKPDPEQPNTLEVTYSDGHRELLNPLPQTLRSSPFLAFSAAGLVTGTVVYGHYGRREDLVKLQALKIPLAGAILLLRHGKIHDGSKVHNAEQAGAAGVLLYPDPQDFAGVNGRFPNGTGLPRDGVMWRSLNTVPGDPATPFLPSLYQIYKAPGASKTLPRIPAQTLSAEAAGRVQELMGGPEVPEGWQGGLDTFYRVGGAWIAGTGVVNVTLAVSNIVYQETLTNVHATLPAADNTKFVMLGCHYGSLYTEPAAGMAGLLAISEAVGKAFPSGTQRKVIFSAWAAGEYGMIGSTEFAQLYSPWVDSSMLAYLSLDEMLQGTGSLRVPPFPLLPKAPRGAAKCGALAPSRAGRGGPAETLNIAENGWRVRLRPFAPCFRSSYVLRAQHASFPHFVVRKGKWEQESLV
ncbi:transferrin receptor protein 2-like [Penaeus chinensis]|uniref:transferrin receptor protein 2-like n=1 Tax=Penaeus chinensis TaxID=139456 RepID=UPI001FB6FB30|nr:transferrin receptor protein 2-like [Penaeus chinensis]